MITLTAFIATAAASIIAAAVAVLVIVALIVLISSARQPERLPEDVVDNEYRTARRAMNDAAGQSWRNLID